LVWRVVGVEDQGGVGSVVADVEPDEVELLDELALTPARDW
jgi:hypothetical protein